MMKAIIVVVVLLLAVVGFFVIRASVSSVVSNTVDTEVAKMVEEERRNLPKSVDDGVTLEAIEHDVENKKLTFIYTFDFDIPRDQHAAVRSATNKRIKENADLARAMRHGVVIRNQFNDSSGSAVLSFSTK